jgi:serine/threonine protein kinase
MQREVVARWFMQQLIAAVDYCHKKGIVSRDIKCVPTPNFSHSLGLGPAVEHVQTEQGIVFLGFELCWLGLASSSITFLYIHTPTPSAHQQSGSLVGLARRFVCWSAHLLLATVV